MGLRDQFERAIQQSGRRVTSLRRKLFRLFEKAARPLSAREVLECLAKHGQEVNKTTVYRELEFLETLGVIHTVPLGSREKTYELIVEDDHHHHLVCTACERIEDISFNESSLQSQVQKISQSKGFFVNRHALEFFGLCKQCHS